MTRYIDADRLLTKTHELFIQPNIELWQVCNLIANAPTADVEEVRHGEWIKKNGIYVCSECDFTCPYDVVGDNIEYWECLYCRNCGAKMDGGKAE